MARGHTQSVPERLWVVLRRRRGLAFVSFALPLAAVLGLALYLPGLYQSRAVVFVEPPLLTSAAPDDAEARLHKLTQENLSRPRLVELVEKLDLYPAERRVSPQAAAEAMRRDVGIETQKVERTGGRTSIAVEITFRGRDPRRVAEAANALASFYVDAERKLWEQQAKTMESELNEVGHRLAEEEERIKEFQRNHLGELPQQVAVHLASMDGLNAQLELIRRNRVEAVERTRALARQLVAPGPDSAPRTDGATEAQVARLELTLKDMQSRYTSEHPDLIRVQREIQSLKSQAKAQAPGEAAPNPVRAKAMNDLRELQTELTSLSQEERRVQGRIGGLENKALNAPRRAQELAALLPPYEAAQKAYEELLRRYEEFRLVHGNNGERGAFRIGEEAVVPTSPTVPNRMRLALVGLALALLVCFGAVALREQLDGSFHEAGDLKAFTRLPVLATIPHFVNKVDRRWARAHTVLRACVAILAVFYMVYGVYVFAHDNEALVRMLVRGQP